MKVVLFITTLLLSFSVSAVVPYDITGGTYGETRAPAQQDQETPSEEDLDFESIEKAPVLLEEQWRKKPASVDEQEEDRDYEIVEE